MEQKSTYAEQIIQFNDELSRVSIDLPLGFRFINPFNGTQRELVTEVVKAFYGKYYNDAHPRRIILGSSPARRGSAIIGIPFEEATHLQNETGVCFDNFHINKSSSNFLFDVINEYGGFEKFYSNFYMNFVCPLGVVRLNSKGKEVNCNYYEDKRLKSILYPFIVSYLKKQVDFGIDSSVCYCIGSGENYLFLSAINQEHHLFNRIIPLEHPRFIMQYNSSRKDEYMAKYLEALRH